jgi:hypothetical protein
MNIRLLSVLSTFKRFLVELKPYLTFQPFLSKTKNNITLGRHFIRTRVKLIVIKLVFVGQHFIILHFFLNHLNS